MKNDDQPEPRNPPFNPHTEVESYLEQCRLSRPWVCVRQIIWLQCMLESESVCPCAYIVYVFYSHLAGACGNVPVLLKHCLLISSLPRRLLCFSAFFFLSFLLWLTEQQAVIAPWALTDHSPQSGCLRSWLGSATSHRGAVGAVQPLRRVAALGWWAAHCETAPSSAQCLLNYSMLFGSKGRRWRVEEVV